MRNGKETRPRGDISRELRDALRNGSMTRQQIRQAFPHFGASSVSKAIFGMLTSGAITNDDGAYSISAHCETEDDYREYLKIVRRQSIRVRDNPPLSFDVTRAAQVGNVLRAAW